MTVGKFGWGGGQKHHLDIDIPNIQPKADFHLCFQANL